MITKEEARDLRIKVYGNSEAEFDDVHYWVSLVAHNYYDPNRQMMSSEVNNPYVNLINDLLLYQYMVHMKKDRV